MPEVVYVLCCVTSALAAALLVRAYRKSRSRLLMWSSLCFVGLALNNLLLVIDLILTSASTDLSIFRQLTALAALVLMIIGLVWESR